jgi:hypothetical protein
VFPAGGDVANETELAAKTSAALGLTNDALAKSAVIIQALQKLQPPAKPDDAPKL